MNLRSLVAMSVPLTLLVGAARADDFQLVLRSIAEQPPGAGKLVRQTERQNWKAQETAVIVCDTWDLHHCLNAVRRLEEFAPRLNDVLIDARRRGATIIHSPSDCMPAYADHPARKRAQSAPVAAELPKDIAHWCSRIPAEEEAIYPIDQSDGGEDDDPAEHADWVAELKAMGRNPGTPWKTQSELIAIDAERDFISDRGDEVWNILRERGVKHVILAGVHTNMCVLGRPFGLRQMVRNGIQVALLRDMTDSMYNPQRWPYVDHFTGNDLVIAHVERFVCPTITSDQIIAGQTFRSKYDRREKTDLLQVGVAPRVDRATLQNRWSLVELPGKWERWTKGAYTDYQGTAWYRCAVRVPGDWGANGLKLLMRHDDAESVRAWCNGVAVSLATEESGGSFGLIPETALVQNDANLLVIRVEHQPGVQGWKHPPELAGKDSTLTLKGRWHLRLGDDPAWSNIPLPARFGAPPDILFEPR
ncbi:MAG: isochorismatase family protein [Planctomycetaceae bacterium]|nr:MAG: isochorismatase family protein [Planctomycetaceae bacterium]